LNVPAVVMEDTLHNTEDTVQSIASEEEDVDLEQGTVSPLECSICLEPFVTNEIVSWSTNPACSHAFHHECIKEWLLRRAGCPFCRNAILAVDCKGTRNFTEKELQKFIDQWRHRTLSTYFCLQEGLVVVNGPIKPASELSPAEKELMVPGVKLADLEAIRGGRGGNGSGDVIENTDCEASY
jgi:hypothetical protein